MNKIFFISDTHFGHDFIAKKRGFNSTQGHDEQLIKNWNSVVDNGDRIYHLGDFIWNGSDAEYILKQLNGNIYCIKGNHDKYGKHNNVIYDKYVEWIKDVFMLKIKNGKNIPSTKMWLSHYRHETWPDQHHSSFHFFGHEHNGTAIIHYDPRIDIPRRYDVGVDGHNLTPVEFNDIIINLKQLNLYSTNYAEILKNARK